MVRAAIYVRVSSTEQAEEGYSIGSQKDKLEAYCKAKDYFLAREYIDPGYSGANINRPAMQSLIADVKNKKIDIVLVMKLDRLSRSQKDTLYLIEDVFMANNCDFASVTESFDTATPMGRAFIGILAVFAQFERDRIRERVEDGKMERAKAGKVMGWRKIPIGYKYNKVTKTYEIDEYEEQIIKRMFDLAEQGIGIKKISEILSEEFPAGTKYSKTSPRLLDEAYAIPVPMGSIKRIIRNPVYIGKVPYKGNLYDGVHPRLITEKQFYNVQKILAQRGDDAKGARQRPFRVAHIYTGLSTCGLCGARIHAQTRRNVNNNAWFYTCYSCSKKGKRYVTADSCTLGELDGETLDTILINQIKQLRISPTKLNEVETSSNISNHCSALKKEILVVDNKLFKIMELYLDDSISKDILERKNAELMSRKGILEKELTNTKKKIKKLSRKEAKTILKDTDALENKDFETQRTIIESLIEHITVYPDHIDIKWNF